MAEPLPIADAAVALRTSVSTLRRDIAAGAPVHRRGGRGRGRRTLVDPAAVLAWKRAQTSEAQLLELAGAVPELVADAVHEAFVASSGPHKRASGSLLADAWYRSTVAILDRCRRYAPSVPELAAVPEKIARIRAVLDDARTFERK